MHSLQFLISLLYFFLNEHDYRLFFRRTEHFVIKTVISSFKKEWLHNLKKANITFFLRQSQPGLFQFFTKFSAVKHSFKVSFPSHNSLLDRVSFGVFTFSRHSYIHAQFLVIYVYTNSDKKFSVIFECPENRQFHNLSLWIALSL